MKLQAKVNDSLCYKGGVTFKFSSNGNILSRELHNKGTQHLFDIITQFLAGYDVSDGIPSYIDIFSGEDSILKHRVPLVGIVWGSAAYNADSSTDARGYLKVTTTIMNDDKNPNISVLTNASIRLLDKNGTPLCIVQDTDEQGTTKLTRLWESVNSTTDGIIEWLLVFGNN